MRRIHILPARILPPYHLDLKRQLAQLSWGFLEAGPCTMKVQASGLSYTLMESEDFARLPPCQEMWYLCEWPLHSIPGVNSSGLFISW